ncbi:restriction endonuclease subunit S [Nocardia bhagyanarayanae]|uniref:Type I restriction enzyme S subunit n=1 Tax=Nocardia bhagyanarayanae TaxID=1215925 RepID=A0A543EWC7_9NOCA|nr:restriction endonuclease subunit S [Nocardia bhagyanarayanae]TQM25898.1 type I restriction enzyme S subunit [Nocardia bhagyanarayanae]
MNSPDWATRRARYCFSIQDKRGVDAPLASATKDGVFLRDELDFSVWNPDSDVSNYKLVQPDDFVIGLRSFQHGLSHSMVRGLVSPAYTVLKCLDGLHPGFYKYYFRSSLLISQLSNITQGIRQGQAIDIESFRNLTIPVPPLGEQRRIADFLDAETSRIDAVVNLRSRQIGLLHAGWIATLSGELDSLESKYGNVRLRYWVSSIQQGWSPQCDDRTVGDNEWGVLKAGCVNTGRFDPSQHKALPPDIAPREEYLLQIGDLLMSRASGSPDLIGSVGVVRDLPAKLLLCDKIYRITPDCRVATAEFLAYVLRGYRNREHVKNGISGAEGMANNLPVSVVKDCLIPKAPIQSQAVVVGRLDRQAAAVESATSALRRSTALLSERRQALITAAVTGQFDVTTASGRNLTQGV